MGRKQQRLQKPARYDELVKARTQILDSIGLTPGYITRLPLHHGLKEMARMTFGRVLYEALDYANEEKWSHSLDDVMQEAESYQDNILGRISTGREVLGEIVHSLIQVGGVNKDKARLERYDHTGVMLNDIFKFLNEGNNSSVRRGIVASLCKSRNEDEKQLGESMIEFMRLARTAKFDDDGKLMKSPGGYVGNLMTAPTRVEILYDSLRKDISFMMVRRKRNKRIAEKLAYRIAIAEEVLYDMLFNFNSFSIQAGHYQKYKNSSNPEERIKARRYKLYDQVFRAIKRSRSDKKSTFEKAFDTFCGIYQEFIIDDFFGAKIGAKNKNAALRIYNSISPMHASSYESVPSWKLPLGTMLESNIPGYHISEIDNHGSVDRLSSLLQIKLKKDINEGLQGPDFYEIMIQTIKDIPFDMFHPEIGHFRYENERKAAIEDMNPWMQQRFEAYSTYLEKMFDKVTSQSILEF
jgi:hypothetical protein